MKKGFFVIGRCYMALLTLFSGLLCVPAVGFIFAFVASECFDVAQAAWIVYGIAAAVGGVQFFLFRKLPLIDRWLTVLLPLVLPGIAFANLSLLESCPMVWLSYALGAILLVCAVAVIVLWSRNSVRYLKKN
ncbi:MAG: hypothetical protein IJ766_08210 [Clostridia bacterium]|nr:hypothetical protein [Clostridia bacterium]